MPRTQVQLETNGIFVLGIRVAQGRRKLGGFPVGNPWVVKAPRQPAAGILGTGPHGVHRTVIHHVLEVLFLVGIPPFDPFARCEGNGRIGHGRHHVHERNAQNGNPKEFRGLVDRRPYQHASSRPPLDGKKIGGGPFGNQKTGNVHEIVEGVLLAKVLCSVGLFVPLTSHLSTTADVRNDVNHASSQQRETSGVKIGLAATAVRTVSVQVHGHSLPILDLVHGILAVHDTDGNFRRSIPGKNFQAIASVRVFLVI
mmetsp:Transcript_8796/g.26103  ORF Transcript_8796/g.26103 Transcript_8796/m.26103 type:complete len:255 (+) Transcript_8796:360-1124(+)